MVSINYSSREVCCKIVYYGPGLSGKTTNLQYVHTKVPAKTRGKLISLATEADRTLYFDFLPINIGTINGLAAKFQLYTVPGQVYYNATRKLVLRGVDGVVFVADSQPDKMEENIESLINLEENLREYGYTLHELPMVIQYNKRDLPGVLPVEQLNARLNGRHWPYFEASATIGNGVFDTLKMIIKMVLERAKSTSATRERVAAAAQPVATGVPSAPTSAVPAESSPGDATVPAQPVRETVSPVPKAPQPEQSPAPQPPPAVEHNQYRPFPGSSGIDTDQSAAPQSQSTEATVPSASPGVPSSSDESASVVSRQPTMAPALRRRTKTKKRGVFKRLFGIM